MDFFERLLGVSPDGGSGALEIALLILVAIAAAAFVWRRRGGVRHRGD